MAGPVAERSAKMVRLYGSEPLQDIAETRPVRLAFVSGDEKSESVISAFEYDSVAVFIGSIDSARDTLRSGKADAFFCDSSDSAGDLVAWLKDSILEGNFDEIAERLAEIV